MGILAVSGQKFVIANPPAPIISIILCGVPPSIPFKEIAINKDDILKWDVKRKLNGRYQNEISFVGSLYDDNLYDKYAIGRQLLHLFII